MLFQEVAALSALRPRLVGCAVATHRYDLLEQFVAQGLSLDEAVMPMGNGVPLGAAALHGDLEMFEKLLALGADPARAFPGASLRDTLARSGSPQAARMQAALDAHEARAVPAD